MDKNHVSSSDQSRARLVLIDGNAILHRAFHALPPLTTSKGELVNAVFGFCSMILKVRDELRPSYFAVSFDLPKPTFRKKIYANYQIKRPKMVDELVGQVEKVKKVVKALGIPIYEKEGYEADDVIGSLAKQATDKHMIINTHDKHVTKKSSVHHVATSCANQLSEVIIVTGDRDLLQLVDDHTKVYMLIRGLTEATLFDEAKVKEKYGLKPGQIPDYKGLVGDASDNYPGVSGIGPKTAVGLISQYGTISNLYKTIKQLDNTTIVDKLLKGKQDAEMSLQLATIITDVPVKLDLGKCKIDNFIKPEVIKIFKELEFKSLISRLKQQENEEDKETREDKEKKNEQMGLFNL